MTKGLIAVGDDPQVAELFPQHFYQLAVSRDTVSGFPVVACPAIHYGSEKWWATLAYTPQLFGSPSPGRTLALDEYEKRELRLKIGYNF